MFDGGPKTTHALGETYPASRLLIPVYFPEKTKSYSQLTPGDTPRGWVAIGPVRLPRIMQLTV
jgi:hypothetical protein